MKIKKQPYVMAKKCHAKTRAGMLCNSYPVTGKTRCRLHGGAEGSGAPIGNSNALKHGFYSKQWKQSFTESKKLVSQFQKLKKFITSANNN